MTNRFDRALLLFALLLATLPLPAGVATAGSMAVSQELDMEYGLAGGATTLQDGRRVGSVDEQSVDVKYVVSPQVTNDLLLRFGVEWERFFFGLPTAGALPETLQQASAVVGFDYQLSDPWLVRAEVQPGIYGDAGSVDWRRFGAPLVVGAVYLQDADLQWILGLRIDPRSHYPVLPAVGVRWKFSDEWTLNFQLPKPRLEYEVSDKLQAYLGAGIKSQTYVVGDHFGDDHGLPKLNHATVDYVEVRSGPGFSWKVNPHLTLEAEAGCLLLRNWDFFDQDVKLESRQAPYLLLALRGRF
ncbi:MAG TPA: DUF6268 family outer membrane beta-barrel protein [Geobacteraceae bacterium]